MDYETLELNLLLGLDIKSLTPQAQRAIALNQLKLPYDGVITDRRRMAETPTGEAILCSWECRIVCGTAIERMKTAKSYLGFDPPAGWNVDTDGAYFRHIPFGQWRIVATFDVPKFQWFWKVERRDVVDWRYGPFNFELIAAVWKLSQKHRVPILFINQLGFEAVAEPES